MKPYLILLSFLLASFDVLAQQNAPVAGQASTLAEVLKKDYSSISPDLRGDQIVQDRALVISIFKSFLRASYPNYTYPALAAVDTDIVHAAKAYTAFTRLKQAAAQTSTATLSTAKAVNAMNAANQGNTVNINNAQISYYQKLETADDDQFAMIAALYHEDSNSFLVDVVSSFRKKYTALLANGMDIQATANVNASITKALPVLGTSLDNSTSVLLQGISEFLAKRIKEELMTYAMQNIKAWVAKKDTTAPVEQLLVLLPTTSAFLLNFNADKISSFPAELKQHIQTDLNNLVDNAYQLRTTTAFKKLIVVHPDIELAFDAIPLVGKINEVQYPGDYFNILSSSQLVADLQTRSDVPSKNIAAFVSLLEMISNSLTVTTNGEPSYTTVNFWKSYGQEPDFMKMYLGFLLQQDLKYYNINLTRRNFSVISLSGQLQAIMADAARAATVFKTVTPILTNICKSSQKIYEEAQTIKKLNNAGQAIGADTVYNFAKSIIDFSSDAANDADQITALFSNSSVDNLHLADKMKPFILVAGTLNNAARDIGKKNYAAGITELLNLTLTLVPEKSTPLHDFLKLYAFSTQTSAVWTDWKRVYLLQNPVTPVDADIVSSAHSIASELLAISAFYSQTIPAPTPAISALLNNLHNELNQVEAGTGLSAEGIADLRTLLTTPAYPELIVSYYAGLQLSAASADLETMMATLKNKKNQFVFTAAQAHQIVTDISPYIPLVFTTKIIQTTISPVDLATLQTTENAVVKDVGVYLAALYPNSTKLDSTAVSIVNFVNDLAQAKTSADVEQAFEAFALPTGSYTVKQNSAFNVAINSYPGILFGREVGSSGTPSTNTLGFTAPVGISVTWGHVFGSDFGVFLPVIDVGAITQLRLSNNTNTNPLPQLTWRNFLSPGVFLTYGIHNTPFSVNVGAQYGPEVQDTKLDVGTSTFRVGIGLTIDIPFFDLYTKPQAP